MNKNYFETIEIPLDLIEKIQATNKNENANDELISEINKYLDSIELKYASLATSLSVFYPNVYLKENNNKSLSEIIYDNDLLNTKSETQIKLLNDIIKLEKKILNIIHYLNSVVEEELSKDCISKK